MPPVDAADAKTSVICDILQAERRKPIRRLLVVGCGSGAEAAVLATRLGADVVGVDLDSRFDPAAAAVATLMHGDATQLPFGDASFDFVYSYHALEHIADPVRALREMRRVAEPGAGYWIGTPNRSRMIGYVGSANTTLSEKLRWNAADWQARLAGRFHNEAGAHAGFTSGELSKLLGSAFASTREVTALYYTHVYPRHRDVISVLIAFGLARFAFPSVYFMGDVR